eukprot:351034-Chlamydomonas_euryale.AAC.3
MPACCCAPHGRVYNAPRRKPDAASPPLRAVHKAPPCSLRGRPLPMSTIRRSVGAARDHELVVRGEPDRLHHLRPHLEAVVGAARDHELVSRVEHDRLRGVRVRVEFAQQLTIVAIEAANAAVITRDHQHAARAVKRALVGRRLRRLGRHDLRDHACVPKLDDAVGVGARQHSPSARERDGVAAVLVAVERLRAQP